MTYLIGTLLTVAIQAAVTVGLLLGRTQRERAMSESEERFRLFVDRVPAMIWSARPDTRLDYFNSTCAQFIVSLARVSETAGIPS